MKNKPRFLDLFAGAGGLSEGFIRAGFKSVAHVESDPAACYTLKTRTAYHWLKSKNKLDIYYGYLNGKIKREELYSKIPKQQIGTVINSVINRQSLDSIFHQIDNLIQNDSLELIIGGPPCQAYSLVGRSRDENRMRGDTRNYLYVYYAEFLRYYQPKYFIFENVTGLLSARTADGISYFDEMRERFNKIGYETEFKILSANDYGVLQNRKRIILVGMRGNKSGFYPDPEKWNPNVKVRELFDDLPFMKSGGGSPFPCHRKQYKGKYLFKSGIRINDSPVTLHWARPNTQQDLEIYQLVVKKWNKEKDRLNYNDLPGRLKTHNNRTSFLDRFKVVAGDLPYSHTVVAHISKDGNYYIHPSLRQNRSITPREAARLQTFPDDYFFESRSGIPSRTPIFQQIGNAVPVLLAEKIANKLMENW